ncbi:MAG: LamG-like jellyroll fold domain-containing protein, partial [Verrucomicrobiales bacterium]
MKKIRTIAALMVALATTSPADESGHQEMDAFMAEAVSLLPVASIIAPGAVANAQVQTPEDRSTFGEWGELIPWPFIPVTAANLPDGRIVTFASNQRTNFPVGPEFTYAGVWDPSTGEHTELNNDNHDMFCAGTAMDVDGQPMFSGGRNAVRSSTVFDWKNDQWVRKASMHGGRWYPSSTTLPDGSIVTASGSIGTGIGRVERYSQDSGWTRLDGVRWVPGMTYDFPHNFVAPNGRLIYTGPAGIMRWIYPDGPGSMIDTPTYFPGGRTGQSGGIVMYDEGKILFAGGAVSGGGTTNVAHVADINSETPVVTAITPMKFRRRYHNALMLPDGKAIVIGGNTTGLAFRDDGSIFAPEMWDPESDTWTELADMSRPRNYHSVALLLPDGRIFSGGGGLSGNVATNHLNAQIFSPPYLFDADGNPAERPQITEAPQASSPGRSIQIAASAGVERFTLVRLAATTHAFTSDIRFLEVPHVEISAGNYRLDLHPNINVLVPGYWMLFAINPQGTPSESSVIQITIPTPPEIVHPGDQQSLLDQQVELDIIAEDGNGDAITFSAPGLPEGLEIDRETGRIFGRPQVLGEFPVTISASDGIAVTEINLSWTVSNDSGLVSYWPFSEGSGSQTSDAASSGQAAALNNGASWTDGSLGSGISFDGDDDHLLTGSLPALNIGQAGADFSVSFWIRLEQESDGLATILHKGGSNNENTFFVALLPNSQKLFFAVTTSSNSLEGTVSDHELPLNEWAHAVLVKENNELSLFLDGAPDQVRTLSGDSISNSGPLYVGADPWHGASKTSMDEIAIYDRALSSSEITFLSNPLNQAIGANPALEITDPGDQISSMSSVSLMIEVSGANGEDLTFSSDGQLPTGLSIDAESGLISGVPTSPGTFTPEITVGDSSRSANVQFQWEIRSSISATTSSPGPIEVGAPAVFSIASPAQDLDYLWNFGDGTASESTSSAVVNHVFQSAGRYTVTVMISDDLGQTTQLSFDQAVHRSLTHQPPAVSQSIVYEESPSSNDRVWNVNPDNDTVCAVDVATNTKLAEIQVGRHPSALAIAPDGQVWVTNKGEATISLIDPNTLAVVASIGLPRASQPHGIAFAPTGSAAFVVLEATGKLIAIDPVSGSITRSVNVGANPRHVSVNHDASKAYVSRFITPPVTGESSASPAPAPGEGGEVVVVDTGSFVVNHTIVLHPSTRPDSTEQARGIPNYLGPAAISPDGTNAWVASKQDNIQRGSGRDGFPLTHDNTVRSITSQINLISGAEDPTLRIDHDNSGTASTSIFGRYGNLVFTALEGSRNVAVTDVFNGVELTRIAAGRAPEGLALSPDGRTLYVHNYMSRSVTAHDVSGIVDGISAEAPLVATFDTVSTEKLTPSVLRGKQHFYDSQDPRLGLEGYISCASCHNDGAQDGRVWDLTGFGEGLRNTIDLRGRAGLAHGPLHWSANFDEVQDFEGQIRNLSGGGGLISNGSPHPSLAAPNAGRSDDLDDLAAYVASLVDYDDSPSRTPEGTLSSAAAAGKAVFVAANCASCHSDDAFTDSAPGTLHDIGTIRPSSGSRLGGILPGLDTPTLRGVVSSAPYLHDGSARTLEEAVAAHSSAASLSPADISQIADYLREIDGSEPAPSPPPSPDETDPDADTIALYHFNSGYEDAGPNSLALESSGGVTLSSSNLGWMQSPSGKVAQFRNIGDTLSTTIPDELILPDSSSPITIEARFYARNYLGYSIDNLPIIALHQDWDAHLQIEDSKWGSAPAGPRCFASGGTLADAQQWADAVAPNSWHHLRISYDGVGTIDLWIDGILINRITTPPNIGRSDDWTLTLGNFDGDIDELLISRSGSLAAGDTTPPTVTLAATSTIISDTVSVSATFSEAVTGFDLGDLSISNGTVSSLVGSGTSFSFDVTPTAYGEISLAVPAARVEDLSGNPNPPSNTLSMVYNQPASGGEEQSPTAQTVALYHFNSDFRDASDHSLDLAASAGVTLASDNLSWMRSPAGNVARFRNVGDTLSANLPDSLVHPAGNSPITIEARIYPRAYLATGDAGLPIISLRQDWDSHIGLEDTSRGSA